MTTTESTPTRNPIDPTAARQQDTDGKFAQGVDKATAGAHQQIDNARNAATPAVEHAAQGAHSAVDKMSGMANRSAEALDLKSEQFGEAKDELIRATQQYLKAHPMASIGIAVAAGYVLSRVLSR